MRIMIKKRFSIHISNQPSLLLLVGAIGAFLGPSILLHGYPFAGDNVSQDLIAQPQFLTLLLLVALYTSVLAILFCPLWSSLRFLRIFYIKPYNFEPISRLLSSFGLPDRYSEWLRRLPSWARFIPVLIELTIILLVTVFFFSAPTLLDDFFPDIFQVPVTSDFPLLSKKIRLLIILGSITFLPAALGIILIPKVAKIELKREFSFDNYIISIKKYLHYRELIQLYLYSSGAIVGLITLFDGALRNLLLAVGVSESDFPLFVVIIFGLYWSAILALYYAIGYLSLLECGRNLQDNICPLYSSKSLVQDIEEHKKIGEILKLDIRADQLFRNSIAILAPLLSGIVSHLLPTP